VASHEVLPRVSLVRAAFGAILRLHPLKPALIALQYRHHRLETPPSF
jgi:hypothetical protein